MTRSELFGEKNFAAAAMTTRWHYRISLEMVTGWVHWIVNMCLTAKNFGLQEENINISKPQVKTTKNGMVYHRKRERDIQMDRKREKEEEIRMQWFMKKEDKNLKEVENVEPTGERCCHLS